MVVYLLFYSKHYKVHVANVHTILVIRFLIYIYAVAYLYLSTGT